MSSCEYALWHDCDTQEPVQGGRVALHAVYNRVADGEHSQAIAIVMF